MMPETKPDFLFITEFVMLVLNFEARKNRLAKKEEKN